MPTTLPHIRIVASGQLGESTPDEIWSCGVKALFYGSPSSPLSGDTPTQAAVNAASAGAATAWAHYIQTFLPGSAEGATFSEAVSLVQVKASAVLANGKDDPAVSPKVTFLPADSRGGGAAGPDAPTPIYSVPYTNSLVITMKGLQYPRGAAAFGRFYPPMPNLYYSTADGVSTKMQNGLVDPTVAAYHAAQAAALLREINASLAFPQSIAVANISTSSAAAGVRSQLVSKVLVDTRPDTVRRRSNKISGRGTQTVVL